MLLQIDCNINVKFVISTTENKTINHLKLNSSDFKIFRTDVFSLYRKMSSLGAPVFFY